MLFRILFAFNALCAAILVFFFFWGLSDGTVSSFNISLWLAILAVAAAVLGSTYFLNAQGQRVLANIILFAFALPGFFYRAFILLIVITQPNWR
jgi:hypothetical protein